MNNLPNEKSSWMEYTNELRKKSKEILNPLTANLELTPRCNFNCKMCYVHLSDSDAKKIGNERSAEEWIDIGRQLAQSGTLRVLLTGGEVFTRPDFCQIYEAFNEMGFVLYVFTNGYLLNESIINWLAKRPPMGIRITLYGASNETYEKVTGVKNAFDRVIRNIDLLLSADLPLSLAATIIEENKDDLKSMQMIADDRKLLLPLTTSVVKSVRGAHSEAEASRIDLNEYFIKNPDIVDNFYLERSNPFEICRSHNCGFWITWDGKMTPCSFIDKPCTYPFEIGFQGAWDKLQIVLQNVKQPAKCENCKYANFCSICPGIIASETGNSEQINDELCEIAKIRYQNYLRKKDSNYL